jgi:hypothetical protein
MFSVDYSDRFSEGKLVYVSSDFSFDTLNCQTQFFSSVLINYIQIEFSMDNESIAVWGLSPQSSWRRCHVAKPESQPGRLRLLEALLPGVSIRIADYWPMIYDTSSGWLYVGQDEKEPIDQSIEFLSGCVAGLREDQICGLWLHPEFQ